MFNNKTLLITGCTGSFGNAILRRFLSTDMSDSGGKRLSSSQNDQNKDELSSLTENYYQRLESVKSKYGGNEIYRMLPNNIKERFIYWDFYFEGVLENPKTFLFGHLDRPNRELYPSAHNYYLDLVYHFGFIYHSEFG